ncbi:MULTISPECIES: DUF1330 domain-containing protein [unclassified Streptomyces]|uniref:DUF1330 domain-containing protein n=1 Tax=unclassified Streptomyces TaxID=2593676 RepID=UPI001F03EB2B|nr:MULTISPECIES: DUF1330 domain-containing protein [unclassified Streptomyces]MCH0564865.1 DUF1330 domain-containing protein [Streptomyces sp. MUM 2J]MCH0569861.1 DUF1330 domain-containing protein [Streptomyces sp. MUM 136J]
MTALLIGNVGIIGDAENMAEYRRRVSRTLELYGGGFVIRGGEFTVLEGDWHPTHLSVMGFPTAEHARRWYHSPEYREIVPLRDGTRMDLILVAGEGE